MSEMSLGVRMSPPKSVSGRLRPFFDIMKPSFFTFTLMAVSETISITSDFTLPSNIERGSPTLTFFAKLYWTGTVIPPLCSKPSADSRINSSSVLRSR